MIYPTNIHDYLEKIGAEPPVDEGELAKAKASIIWCDSIEEAVEAITKLDDNTRQHEHGTQNSKFSE